MKTTAVADRPASPEVDKLDQTVGCIGWLVLFVPMIVLGGFLLQSMWAWFLTPVFQVDAPSIATCLGISVFVNYLKPTAITKGDPDLLKKLFESIFRLLFVWGGAYLCHLAVDAGW